MKRSGSMVKYRRWRIIIRRMFHYYIKTRLKIRKTLNCYNSRGNNSLSTDERSLEAQNRSF